MPLDVFTQLSLVIVIAAIVAGIMRLLRQPIIIGYMLTGLIVGPYLLNVIHSKETFDIFAELGIALLLFIVGLNLNPKAIKEVGRAAVLAGIGQIVFTALASFFLIRYLNYPAVSALYIAVAITLSSTIIVLKLLGDKGDINSLYGKITVGLLIVQDIFAALLLVAISALSKGSNVGQVLLETSIKGAVLIFLLTLVSRYVLPRLASFFARSQEFLFLFALAWGLGLATLLHAAGFSIEIGALATGVMLSLSPYHLEISSKLRPLRDFFVILFFIFMGAQMSFGSVPELIYPAIILSAFVLLAKPLILLAITGALGYHRRTGFLSGLSIAQVSEFSLILMLLGMKLGHVSADDLSLLTMVALITIAISSYLITYGEKIYPFLSGALSVFQRKRFKEEKKFDDSYEAILFGYDRVGYDFVRSFKKLGAKYLVVDFNPEMIQKLKASKISCAYGDAEDSEFLDELELRTARIIVSTVPNFDTNKFLISHIRKYSRDAVIMVISHSIDEASKLYKAGASYVILPHFLGGHYGSKLIKEIGFNPYKFKDIKDKHLKYLARRKGMGHVHP